MLLPQYVSRAPRLRESSDVIDRAVAGCSFAPGRHGKVAILRASRIGDFLLAVPALRALRSFWPQAEIVLKGCGQDRRGPILPTTKPDQV